MNTAEKRVARSNRLGADPRNTNYAGGNRSAKGTVVDPVTSVLRLDRLRALADVYPGVEREDETVAAFDYCLHGRGGAAPSIDTAMHALVDAPHVDHLHPDSGIALATAVDGERLTRQCFGDRVAWVPWRRPGFQLGLDIAAIARENPQAIGCVLGGHGITAWGATSEQCEANSLSITRTAERFIATNRPRSRGAFSIAWRSLSGALSTTPGESAASQLTWSTLSAAVPPTRSSVNS